MTTRHIFTDACELAEQLDLPSRYVRAFKPRKRFVLFCRVSTGKQGKLGNNCDQDSNLSNLVARYGSEIVAVITYEGSGFFPSHKFYKAVMLAKKYKATILAETTCRFIRHRAFHSKTNPDAQAGFEQLEVLASAADGVELMTMLHPDASPTEVRSFQRMRGRAAKGRRGGRPRIEHASNRPMTYGSRLNADTARELRKLLRDEFSGRQIAIALQRPSRTVHGWIKQLGC